MWMAECLLRRLFSLVRTTTIADAFYRAVIVEADSDRRTEMCSIIHKLDKKIKIFYGEIHS